MIRIRRIAGRIPVGRVYEIEYRPKGGTRDDGLYGATRSPEAYLEEPFGADLVRALVAQADWEWQRGNKDWAVAFDESTGGPYECAAPRLGLAPLSKGVGWWWLVPQVVWLALGACLYGASLSDPNPEAAAMGLGFTFVFFLFPLGLPWTLVTGFLIPWLGTDHGLGEPWLGVLCFGPAVLNVLLNGAYRILRWQRIQAARQLAGSSSDGAAP